MERERFASMAPSHGATLTFLVVLLFFYTPATTAQAAGDCTNGTMTHLHFYFHEIFSGGPNGTTVEVAPARRGGSPYGFGFVVVADNMLREGPDPASRLIGRAQALAASASLTEVALLTLINFVFTDGPCEGSTLAVFGRAVLGTVMERPIVGGTGAFRMARGYTVSKVINSPDPKNLTVVEFDAYVWL